MTFVTKYTIDDLIAFAETKGGTCLSRKYRGYLSRYSWQCENGHVFSMPWDRVRATTAWCVVCNRYSIDDLRAFAESKGGKCLSKRYVNPGITKYKWRCAHGHVWSTTWSKVRDGWCKKCLYGRDIGILKKYAKEKGGKCLSRQYNEKLKIAFEYNGRQHYRAGCMLNHGRHVANDVAGEKYRDAVKVRLCRKNDVLLIVIPYTINNKKSFIEARLRANGLL